MATKIVLQDSSESKTHRCKTHRCKTHWANVYAVILDPMGRTRTRRRRTRRSRSNSITNLTLWYHSSENKNRARKSLMVAFVSLFLPSPQPPIPPSILDRGILLMRPWGNRARRTSFGAQSKAGSWAITVVDRSGRRNAAATAVAPPNECPMNDCSLVWSRPTKDSPIRSSSGMLCSFRLWTAMVAAKTSLHRRSVWSLLMSVGVGMNMKGTKLEIIGMRLAIG